ncbi:hypothetical protein VP01_6500g1 [Puccinia sorghi]|uniref:Tet-like 2OG-Fe(II) oxygenase domain-containing protein n=1 Tax=Puccinia sorghi TaxID=27349 RepID=A0A0L6UFJ7_9BASI|nr:hypothetical protein VP01_6500g1 [Puccinia sorghi]
MRAPFPRVSLYQCKAYNRCGKKNCLTPHCQSHKGTCEVPYISSYSPSQTPQSTKPLISLPNLNSPHRQAIVSSTYVPHFIIEYHSILENPPTSTFNTLSQIIQILYTMDQFHPANNVKSNIMTGEMHMIGFCPGSDRGKSAGIYARKELTTALDDENRAKLQSHNIFLAGCMESISRMAYQQNNSLIQEYGIPNWSQVEWVEMKKDDGIEYHHAKFDVKTCQVK